MQNCKKCKEIHPERSGVKTSRSETRASYPTCVFTQSAARDQTEDRCPLGIIKPSATPCKLTSVVATLPLVHRHYVRVQVCSQADKETAGEGPNFCAQSGNTGNEALRRRFGGASSPARSIPCVETGGGERDSARFIHRHRSADAQTEEKRRLITSI